MRKSIKFMAAVFLALGAMITISPREGRSREAVPVPDDSQKGLGRHFVAAWDHLSNAVLLNEE